MNKCRPKSKGNQPQYLITYLCGRCGFNFTRTEKEIKPKCSMCSASCGHTEIGREKLTPKSLFKSMARSLERMNSSMASAYKIIEEEGEHFPGEEIKLLKAMSHGEHLKEQVEKMKKSLKA